MWYIKTRLPHVGALQCFSCILLSLKLHKGKVPPNADIENLPIGLEVSFYVVDFSTHRIKVNHKKGLSWPLICSFPVTMPTTFTL